MTGATTLRQTTRTLQHAARHRALEVSVLQASPLLGAAFGGGLRAAQLGQLSILLLGSLLLTAHVFAFNDWAGRLGDLNDPRRAPRVFARHGIGSRDVAALTVALLVAAMVALSALGLQTALLGATIACLGILYSDSEVAGKGVPILASVIHLLGGTVHFLLGYAVVAPLDRRGLAIALFFGLVFAGGHLNQEVRDHDGDARNGIRTSAVAFGARHALVASLVVFTAAYGLLALLALLGAVPRVLLATALLWPFHLGWTLQALRRGAGFDEARWLQRRYRGLFALVGIAMLASLAAPPPPRSRAAAAGPRPTAAHATHAPGARGAPSTPPASPRAAR
jgi:4-hydroxybenzoate polyprenyltransferase